MYSCSSGHRYFRSYQQPGWFQFVQFQRLDISSKNPSYTPVEDMQKTKKVLLKRSMNFILIFLYTISRWQWSTVYCYLVCLLIHLDTVALHTCALYRPFENWKQGTVWLQIHSKKFLNYNELLTPFVDERASFVISLFTDFNYIAPYCPMFVTW